MFHLQPDCNLLWLLFALSHFAAFGDCKVLQLEAKNNFPATAFPNAICSMDPTPRRFAARSKFNSKANHTASVVLLETQLCWRAEKDWLRRLKYNLNILKGKTGFNVWILGKDTACNFLTQRQTASMFCHHLGIHTVLFPSSYLNFHQRILLVNLHKGFV